MDHDVVLDGEGIPFVGDFYNLTFVRIKLHEPVPFPFLVSSANTGSTVLKGILSLCKSLHKGNFL